MGRIMNKHLIKFMQSHDRKGEKRLGKHEASVNYFQMRRCQIIFNQDISKDIIEKGLMRCIVSEDKEKHRLFLVFTKMDGHKVTKNGQNGQTASVNTYYIYDKVMEFFGLTGMFGNYRLHISGNLSKIADCITLQLMKCSSLNVLRGARMQSKTDDMVKTLPTEIPSTISKEPDIKTCIRILKQAGYKIMAPITDYREV